MEKEGFLKKNGVTYKLDADKIMDAFGLAGRQQLVMFIIINCVFGFYCAQMMIMVFIGEASSFTCVSVSDTLSGQRPGSH